MAEILRFHRGTILICIKHQNQLMRGAERRIFKKHNPAGHLDRSAVVTTMDMWMTPPRAAGTANGSILTEESGK
jgi:hypothetical protein